MKTPDVIRSWDTLPQALVGSGLVEVPVRVLLKHPTKVGLVEDYQVALSLAMETIRSIVSGLSRRGWAPRRRDFLLQMSLNRSRCHRSSVLGFTR